MQYNNNGDFKKTSHTGRRKAVEDPVLPFPPPGMLARLCQGGSITTACSWVAHRLFHRLHTTLLPPGPWQETGWQDPKRKRFGAQLSRLAGQQCLGKTPGDNAAAADVLCYLGAGGDDTLFPCLRAGAQNRKQNIAGWTPSLSFHLQRKISFEQKGRFCV